MNRAQLVRISLDPLGLAEVDLLSTRSRARDDVAGVDFGQIVCVGIASGPAGAWNKTAWTTSMMGLNLPSSELSSSMSIEPPAVGSTAGLLLNYREMWNGISRRHDQRIKRRMPTFWSRELDRRGVHRCVSRDWWQGRPT